MCVGFKTCSMRGARSRRGKSNTTKNARTVVWDIGRRRSLLQRCGRLRPAPLYWLRRPQPQTRMQKVSYDAVREEWGQVTPIMYKRKSFEHERELRAAIWTLEHGKNNWGLDNKFKDVSGLYVPVDI